MNCNHDYIRQNQNSDFSIIERFILKGVAQPIDSFNWKLEYFTNTSYVKKVAEHRDGVFTGCEKNDDYSVLVVFNNPQFSTGVLNKVAHLEFPNPVFPDGIENVVIPARTNIEIIKGASSTMGRTESEVVMSYVQGKSGHSPYFNEDTQSWWQFNDETRQWEDTGIGGGGSGGTSDHRQLTAVSRNAENQHPIGAITGLTAKLEAQDNAITQLSGDVNSLRQDVEDLGEAQENLQPKLVSGQNIATINGKSLLTGENIVITGGSIDFEDVAPGEFFGTQASDPVPVTGIVLSPSTFTLNVGAQRTIVPVISPSNASNKSVTWLSSDPTIATVVNGLVTAIKEGTVTITATAADGSGVSGTSSGTIEKVEPGVILVTEVSLSKTSLTLDAGVTEQLTATVLPANATNKTLEWVSSNPAVATVVNGLVTAVSGGNATISVSATDGSGVSASCPVTVQAVVPVASLIADYDFSEYPDGYQGEIADLSGNGNTPTVTGLELYTTGRAGMLNGTFMVNVGKTSGSGIALELPAALSDPNSMTFEMYAHYRTNYNPYMADGVKELYIVAATLSNAAIFSVGNNASELRILQDQIQVKGALSSPILAAPIEPPIRIDGIDDGTITNAFHHVVFVVSKTRFAGYLDGELIVETGGNTYDYRNKVVQFLWYSIRGDIKRIRVYNEALTSGQVAEKYAEIIDQYGE